MASQSMPFAPLVNDRPNYVELSPSASLTSSNGAKLETPAPGATDYKVPQLPVFRESNDPLQMIVSVVAAARGNVGPLMSILDQKRKTQVYAAIPEIFTNYNALINRGEIDKATDYFTGAIGQLGARAPEIGQFLQPVLTSATQRQKDFQNMRSTLTAYDDYLTKNPNAPKFVHDAVATLKKIKTPMDAATFQAVRQNMLEVENRLLPSGTGVLTSSKLGAQETTPVQSYGKIGDYGKYTMSQLSAETGLQEAQIINAMNGVPVVINGKDVTESARAYVASRLPQLQAIEAQMTLTSGVKLPPEIEAAHLRNLQQAMGQGAAANIAAATRSGVVQQPTGTVTLQGAQAPTAQIGGQGAQAPQGVTPSIAQATDEEYKRRLELANVDFENKYTKQPTHIGFPGNVAVNIDVNSPDFIGRTDETLQTVTQNPTTRRSLPEKIYYEKVVPAHNAIKQLDRVKDLMDIRGMPTSYSEIIPTGLVSELSRRTGMSFDTGITVGRAYEAIIERGLNSALRTEAINSQVVDNAKQLMSGGFASADEALRIANTIQQDMKRQLVTYIGQNASKIPLRTEPVQPPPTQETVVRQQTTSSLANEQAVMQGVFEPIRTVVSGLKDINQPLRTSSGWTPNIESQLRVSPTFTGRQVLESFINPAIKTLKQANPKLKESDYQLTPKDTTTTALVKFEMVRDLINAQIENRKPGLKWDQRRK